jgi:hypothetical protein
LCPADAAPLKRELAAAFGSMELTLDGGEAMSGAVVEGEVLITGPLALPAHTVAPHPES